MNFLGHLCLSGNDQELMLGNFMGDFVKGRKYENYSGKIRKGILLHREIDSFTDKHPLVAQSKQKLKPAFGLYAGVIVDIFYDHFLAKNFQHFQPQTLEAFSQQFYQYARTQWALLPDRIKKFFPYMEEQNWLVAYRQQEGIARTLNGLDRRTVGTTTLADSVELLEEHYLAFEAEFLDFFPKALAHVGQLLRDS